MRPNITTNLLNKSGDPTGIRTRVTAVKGRCLNRLTMGPYKKTGDVLISQAASHQVSSALKSLTSVFGMGTGVTSLLLSPDYVNRFRNLLIYFVVRCTLSSSTLLRAVPSKLNNHLMLKTIWSSVRPISISQLNTLPYLHL